MEREKEETEREKGGRTEKEIRTEKCNLYGWESVI